MRRPSLVLVLAARQHRGDGRRGPVGGGRALGQRCQISGFGNRQFRHRLVEIGECSTCDAIGIEADLSEREEQCVDLEVWPENEPALAVFGAMLTQWHQNGLIYAALPAVMGFMKIPPEEQADVFADLQILESETIKVLGANHV